MTGGEIYLAEPEHATWAWHYEPCSKGVQLLFTKAFRDKHLPKDCQYGLTIVYRDRTDGKLYTKENFFAGYEDELRNFWPMRKDGILCEEVKGVIALQDYFYCQHNCPCHRKQDCEEAGAEVPDGECEGDRFQTHEITCPSLPGLVLYSETRTCDELNEQLSPTYWHDKYGI